jgi:hypothetical protein
MKNVAPCLKCLKNSSVEVPWWCLCEKFGKTHKNTFILSFVPIHVSPLPILCSMHFSMVQIVAPKSTMHREFRTPPDHYAFNRRGGGGPKSIITLAHIWTAQGRALKSTVHNGFQTPSSILPLMEGEGSEMSIKEHAKICGLETSA